MPSLYLPSFARAVGLSAFFGIIAVSLMNAANAAGLTISCIMADKVHVTTTINFCTIGSVTAVFLFWLFAVYTPVLFLFAFLDGLFTGGFISTWSGIVDPIRRKYPATDAGMVVSCFAMGKDIASIVSGPFSGSLVQSDAWKNSGSYAFGSGYGVLMVFLGVTVGLSMIG